MKEKIINLLENGDADDLRNFISRYLNDDYTEFFKLLEKIGIMDGDEFYPVITEEFPMSYLHYRYMVNPDSTVNHIINEYFSDIIYKDGRLFLHLDKMEDLSIFFKDDGGRDTGSKEMAKLIFQEDWWEPFDDTLSSLYDEVIENLNSKNLSSLAHSIYNELSDSEISPSTSLLEDIATDQGHPEYVELSVDLILNTIFNDKESTNRLLDEAANVSSELYSLYHNSYNTAYIDEKYKIASDEVKSLLSIDNIGNWKSRKVKTVDGKEKTINDYYIDVTNFVPYVIDSIFKDDYMNDDYRNAFEYHGYFEDLVIEVIKEEVIEGGTISVGYYDYPDHERVNQYLNDMFEDYI